MAMISLKLLNIMCKIYKGRARTVYVYSVLESILRKTENALQYFVMVFIFAL